MNLHGAQRSGVVEGGSSSGGAKAFESVYRDECDGLVRIAYLIVRSTAVAEDVVHEGFIRLHDHFGDVDNPSGFLRTVVVRLCLNVLSRRRMEHDRLVLLSGTPPVSEHEDTAVEADEMWGALGRIDPDRRAVIVLRYYCDLSHAEIAGLVGCPVTTVRTRVHRGLVDLRKELSSR